MASCESGDGDVAVYMCESSKDGCCPQRAFEKLQDYGFRLCACGCIMPLEFTHDRRFKGGFDDPEGPIMTVIGE